MSISLSLSDRFCRDRSRERRNAERERKASRRVPRIETLERRALLAAGIFHVTNLDDEGAGSLRNAIEAANANPGADTIRFAGGLSGEIALDPANGTLAITDDLRIRGRGSDRISVSGEGAMRVFSVLPAALAGNPYATPTVADLETSPAVTIERLAIRNGLATDALGFDPADAATSVFAFGGGLYNLGGEVHLDRVTMTGNTAANVVTAGGAVANEFGGILTVSRSHFEDNASTGFLIGVGGAITSDLGPMAGGGTTDPPTVDIDRSSFVGNRAESMAGYIDGEGFSGLGGGGAILNVTGAMSISRSEFLDNAAQGGLGVASTGEGGSTSGGAGFGGAILSGDISPFGIAESTLDVERSRFVGNTASGGDGGADQLPGGQAAGGAISVTSGSDATLTRNQIRGNSSFGGAGGANAGGGVATGGGVAASGGTTLNQQRNSFVGNLAEGGSGDGTGAAAAGRGGGLGLHSIELAGFVPGIGSATLSHDQYHGNTAVGGIGGGVYNEGDLTVKKTTFSDNAAIGKTDVLIDFVPGYAFQGGALGGGLSNLGTVAMVDARFDGNRAVGADGGAGPNFVPDQILPTYPGLAVAGGFHNINEATVTRSRFVGNDAVGGDGNFGSFAGVTNGGGIYNDGKLELSHSRVERNRAVGGDDNTGDINAGGAYGGGISSGSVTALFGLRNASLVVQHSVLKRNEAVGGDGSQDLFSVPQAHAPGVGIGGGLLVYQGTAELSKVQIVDNVAAGGEGGIGAGGGAFFFSFVGPIELSMSGGLVAGNSAIGGVGADGFGGGIAAGSLGSFLGGPANVSIGHSLVFGNLAKGGDGDAGESGGDALGGGIFNGSDADLVLRRSLAFVNRAIGGPGGDGIGGGLYNLGDVERIRARIFANFASTDDDNCFGC